jgi:DNA-binding CsgD family transcriptional regulator/PAS domain-containing protein
MSQARLLALTEDIYDAAAGGTPWSAVGHGLAAMVHARSASLMVSDPQGSGAELLCHAGIPHEAVAAYAAEYRAHDLWTRRAASLASGESPAPRVFASGQLVPDREFLRSEFWNGFGRRYGLRFVVGTVAPLGAAGSMPIGLHRPEGMGAFDEAEKRLVETALPHLRRALQLRHRLAQPAAPATGTGLAVLDALPTGVLVLDAGMRVVLANAAAERMASAGQGLRLVQEGSRDLSPTRAVALHRPEAESLSRLVAGVASAGEAGGAVRLRDAAGAAVAAASVAPLPSRFADQPFRLAGRVPGQALVLLRDLVPSDAPRAAVLRDLFGLTSAEAEVARSLARGVTKAEVAGARGASEATVRSQVRAVLAKTGAANLRDLEGMLGGLRDL